MLKANIQRTLDLHKIERFMSESAVQILVGFPSGRQHVETFHKDPDEGGYKDTFGDPREKEPIETAELARMLSFGTADIPARPFLEEGIASKRDELREEIKKQIENAQNDRANWDKVGTKAVGAIQEFVRGDYYRTAVPNSKTTIEYKGSDTPLIDGGDLINATTYLIEGK